MTHRPNHAAPGDRLAAARKNADRIIPPGRPWIDAAIYAFLAATAVTLVAASILV